MEVVAVKRKNMETKWQTYKDLLAEENNQIKMKKYDILKQAELCWLQYHQLNIIFEEDRKTNGFDNKISDLDRERLSNDKKNLSKTCKLLLNWNLKDEVVKDVMVKWAQDFGYNTELEKWENLWKSDIKFIACYLIKLFEDDIQVVPDLKKKK